MKKTLFILIALIALAGCQKQESQQQQPDMDQRKDIGRKLIMKSLNDLQNKDLKSTIMDLETSIRFNPSEPEAYLLLGQILLKIQEYDHAADFLDVAAKNFPDNGTVFYMLSIANKMAGKKLPAVLAARHSVEVFQAQQDRDNMLKSAALLHELIDMPDNPSAPMPKPDAAQSSSPDAGGQRLVMHPLVKGLVFLIVAFWPMVSFAETIEVDKGIGMPLTPTEAQKIKSQADDLEDKSAQAIDDGNMGQGMDFMVQAIHLDPSPMRYMNYGSILFGNGVTVFKESDQQKGKEILLQAEGQLQKAIKAFNPNKDQVYLSQCYFLLGEMYRNAFADKIKAKEYYKKAADLSDYTGAKDALNKLSS